MDKGVVTIRTRKFMRNPLLHRRQFVVEILHPGRACVPKSEAAERIAQMYNCDAQNVVLFGFRYAFGGGRTTGFGLIYDDMDSLLSIEPRYRLVRKGLAKAREGSRKQRKERKNRALRARGKARAKILYA
jgi:small subunit ribosomal protein S24e